MELCKSILVADDNDDIRETIVKILTTKGYKVTGAKNGKEALLKLKTLPVPSMVLLDLMMPVMDGWKFLGVQQRESQFAGHKVIMMSAVDTSLGDVPIKTAGSIQKPFTFGNLWKKVQEFCGPPPNESPNESVLDKNNPEKISEKASAKSQNQRSL